MKYLYIACHIDEYDIKTDDEFILNDYIKKRIESIPITQNMENYDIDKFAINLHRENATTECMNIYTRDFDILYDNKPYTGVHFFSENINVFSLKPIKKINITNIQITKGIAKDDASKFLLLSNITYKILDSKPLEKDKFKKTGESSLNSNPSKFLFKLTNHRNFKLKKILNICFNNIVNRLDNINTDIKKIKESDVGYISDIIKLETVGKFKLIYLIDEYWTISNVISRYCYLQDKDIDFVCSSIIHPTTEMSIIKIKHKNYLKILTNSIENIIKDMKKIKSSF